MNPWAINEFKTWLKDQQERMSSQMASPQARILTAIIFDDLQKELQVLFDDESDKLQKETLDKNA